VFAIEICFTDMVIQQLYYTRTRINIFIYEFDGVKIHLSSKYINKENIYMS
jgi:hypothetical protein